MTSQNLYLLRWPDDLARPRLKFFSKFFLSLSRLMFCRHINHWRIIVEESDWNQRAGLSLTIRDSNQFRIILQIMLRYMLMQSQPQKLSKRYFYPRDSFKPSNKCRRVSRFTSSFLHNSMIMTWQKWSDNRFLTFGRHSKNDLKSESHSSLIKFLGWLIPLHYCSRLNGMFEYSQLNDL